MATVTFTSSGLSGPTRFLGFLIDVFTGAYSSSPSSINDTTNQYYVTSGSGSPVIGEMLITESTANGGDVITDFKVGSANIDYEISGLSVDFSQFNNALKDGDGSVKNAALAKTFLGVGWTIDLSQSTFDNQLFGTGGNDVFTLGSGADQLFLDGGLDSDDTGAGNDTIYAANLYGILVRGEATVDGGKGEDTFALDYRSPGAKTVSFFTVGQTVDLAEGIFVETLPHKTTNSITLTGIEDVAGTKFGDRLSGTNHDNVLTGEEGNDTLIGRDGNDTLIGGAGADILTGGAGKDDFVYAAAGDSGNSAKTFDTITDFTHKQDKLDFSALTLPKHGQFKLIGSHAFDHHAGEIQVIEHDAAGKAHDDTMVSVDIDGNGKADLLIELTGLVHLDNGDFHF